MTANKTLHHLNMALGSESRHKGPISKKDENSPGLSRFHKASKCGLKTKVQIDQSGLYQVNSVCPQTRNSLRAAVLT